jgi:ABC-type iron transport system FetAB permease component
MGIVSLNTASMRVGELACLMALIPRSDSARLMDLVKFRGVVEGSRRSYQGQGSDL